MNKRTSICIIVIFFGKFPNYFKLWLKSCEYNSTIDFLLVTDQEITYQLPPNIHFFHYTLQQIQQNATEILGFTAVLNHPYKCCDFRPMYGLLFYKQLKEYNYWGYCDIDIIFGDIRYFTNKYELEKYDKFLVLGHLSLYKNTEKVNNGYILNGATSFTKKAINYKEVFSKDASCFFDEIIGIYSIFIKNNFSVFTKNIFADISTKFTRYRIADDTYYYNIQQQKPINYKYQIFYWEKGKIKRAYYKKGTIHTEEYIYIHLQKRPNFNINFNEKTTNSFYITHLGFFSKSGLISKKEIQKLVPYNILQEKYRLLQIRTNFYWKKIKKILIYFLFKK